jgi:hypothetical protein
MAIYFKLCENSKGEYTHILIDDKYEIRKDGKIYSAKFVNKELFEYPDYLNNRKIKQLINALWKS